MKLIRKGDVLLGARDELRRSPMRYKVLEVIPIWLGRRMLFGYLTLMGELKATATLKVNGRRRWRVERLAKCGSPVCFRHCREIDDNVHLCRHCAAGMG